MSSGLAIHEMRIRRGAGTVVHVPEVTVDAGTLTVVAAAGATGKTTLASALCGAIDATGDVTVSGRRATGPPSRRARVGLRAAVRDGRVIAGCSVREALAVAAPTTGAAAIDDALRRLPAIATRAGVDSLFLSGGEQQLLQVACAWLGAASVLVLDAPTVGLAADAAGAVRQMALDAAARGVAVLWLEPDDRAAPAPPAYRLHGGTVTPL